MGAKQRVVASAVVLGREAEGGGIQLPSNDGGEGYAQLPRRRGLAPELVT